MSISSDNKSIKIPAQHYVGFNKRGDEEIPLGFMTVEGTDAAAVKRKATVDSWAAGGNKNKIAAQVFDNNPLSGFKMGRNIRRYSGWGQGNVKWRIEDPRGFELEITSPNLASILACTTIENGEILEKCIWARLGADNILLPISSDAYKAATANTERVSKTVSSRDVKPGDHVIMHNGLEGRYIGSFFLIKRENYNEHLLLIDGKKRFIVESQKNEKQVFVAVLTPKISESTSGEAITPADGERLINDACKSGDRIETNGYGTYVGVSTTSRPTFTYALTPFETRLDAQTAMTDKTYGHCAIIGKIGDDWGIFREASPYGHRNKNDHLLLMNIISLTANNKISHINERQRNGWYSNHEQPVARDILPTDSVNWFLHQGKFETPDGYTREIFF